MFGAIRKTWREERASELRKEFLGFEPTNGERQASVNRAVYSSPFVWNDPEWAKSRNRALPNSRIRRIDKSRMTRTCRCAGAAVAPRELCRYVWSSCRPRTQPGGGGVGRAPLLTPQFERPTKPRLVMRIANDTPLGHPADRVPDDDVASRRSLLNTRGPVALRGRGEPTT